MTVATDGIICYGFVLEEDAEFPWADSEYEDEEEWWYKGILGYSPKFDVECEELQKEIAKVRVIGRDPKRNAEALTDLQPLLEEERLLLRKYLDDRTAFQKANPMPFEVVNYCSSSYPAYILAVWGTVNHCGRGYPTELNIREDFNVSDDSINKFIDFCKKFGFWKEETELKWYLCSFWEE